MIITPERTAPIRRGRVGGDLTAVFALAFLVRMAFVVSSSGGVSGTFGYDAGVYYSSAASFLHGSVPYRDFTLLHPPGIMLALVPFAAIGRITNDHTGFVAANTTFVALAAVNAALVVAISRRLGLSRVAGLLGGAFYAVWSGAVGAEVSVRLEPLGSFAFLCGLLLLTRIGTNSRQTAAAAGAAMGAAVCVKIWWIVPPLVVLAWLALRRGTRRRALPFLAGVTGSLVLVTAPFVVAARSAMWRMVVTDQLGRHAAGSTGLARATALTSVHTHNVALGIACVGAAAIVLTALTIRAWRTAPGRLVVPLLGAQLIVLIAAPTYFGYYADYVAPAAAMLVAAAAHAGPSHVINPVRASAPRLALAGAGLVTACSLVFGAGSSIRPFPADPLSDSLGPVRCLMADSPMALIELNSLSRNLRNHCPNWVDVSGRTYDVDAARNGFRPRRSNRLWQSAIMRYFRSGDAVILIRPATGLSRVTLHVIESWPVLVRSRGFTVYRTPRGLEAEPSADRD